mmetsp:Transcript_36542/g.103983  ORF Transcript_36542/g.103983 Transcript_36542/m.103983 type:complete len:210 (-) Transcript_36542:210-839(-)
MSSCKVHSKLLVGDVLCCRDTSAMEEPLLVRRLVQDVQAWRARAETPHGGRQHLRHEGPNGRCLHAHPHALTSPLVRHPRGDVLHTYDLRNLKPHRDLFATPIARALADEGLVDELLDGPHEVGGQLDLHNALGAAPAAAQHGADVPTGGQHRSQAASRRLANRARPHRRFLFRGAAEAQGAPVPIAGPLHGGEVQQNLAVEHGDVVDL